jgi:hypothetical protein
MRSKEATRDKPKAKTTIYMLEEIEILLDEGYII